MQCTILKDEMWKHRDSNFENGVKILASSNSQKKLFYIKVALFNVNDLEPILSTKDKYINVTL